MQTTQSSITQTGSIPAISPISALLANGEDVSLTLNDFFSSDEYEDSPSSVELTLTPVTIWALRKAAETMVRNPCFEAIDINTFDWNADEDYEGKARYGKLSVRWGREYEIEFSFSNAWSDTRFSAFLDYPVVQALLSAPLNIA